MANDIDIYLKGHDQASGAITDVDRKLGGLGNTATIAKGTLAGMLSANVIAQIGNLGLKAIEGAIALGQMGEASAQLDSKFQAVSGSASTARERFSEMDAAVGNWLTRDAKMETSIRIMSLGLADSATAAGELARTAILLGDSTQTAEQRIDSFTQMLATGQTRGLASFGISVIAVKDRVAELTAADETLTTQMATQQAVMEAATERAQLLGDYLPITQTQQMANAVADMKDSLGDLVAQPYIISVKFLTEGVENIISLLNRTSNDAGQQLTGMEQQLKNAKEELAAMQQTTGKGILGGLLNQKYSPEQIAAAQKDIDDLTAKIAYMATTQTASGDVGVAALDKQSNAAILLKDNLQAVEDKLLAIEEKTKPTATDVTLEPGKTKVDAAKLISDLQNGLFSPEVISGLDVNTMASAPGMAGLARKSVEAFSLALNAATGTNMAIIDALLNIKADDKGISTASTATSDAMGKLATQAQESFTKAISAQPGASGIVVDTLLGFKVDEKGERPADKAVTKAMNQFASAVGATVKGEDFAGKMIGYGETVWGYTEEGMINKAKSSGAFQAAIDAMVAAAIAGALQ